MLTQTSELALRALSLLGLEGGSTPVPPRSLAQRLACSQSYLVKTLGMLARAGILRSVRGAHGGVLLARAPADVTLLGVVEACQGLIVGKYCEKLHGHGAGVCAFHEAMEDVHRATVEALSRWTLADMLARPVGGTANQDPPRCKMSFRGCEPYCAGSGGGAGAGAGPGSAVVSPLHGSLE